MLNFSCYFTVAFNDFVVCIYVKHLDYIAEQKQGIETSKEV